MRSSLIHLFSDTLLAAYVEVHLFGFTGPVHPDHDTIASFRKQFLEEIKDLFVQILREENTPVA